MLGREPDGFLETEGLRADGRRREDDEAQNDGDEFGDPNQGYSLVVAVFFPARLRSEDRPASLEFPGGNGQHGRRAGRLVVNRWSMGCNGKNASSVIPLTASGRLTSSRRTSMCGIMMSCK